MFEFSIQPRFSETDALGHINNTAVPVWFEEARTEIFRIFNPEMELGTWNLIVRKFEIDFVAQIQYRESVFIKTGIERLGNSSFVIWQEAEQQGVTVATCRTVMVHFDYEQQRSVPISESVRNQLHNHQFGPEEAQ